MTPLSIAVRCLVGSLLFVSCAAVESAEGDGDARPNILFVLADDQSPFDLQVYEPGSVLATPHLDRLAAEGTVIDGAYHMGSWSGAVCYPSRCMIMTGRTLWHLHSRGIGGEEANPNCPADIADESLGAVFARNGYRTMRTCKRGNSFPAANERFEVSRLATKRGAGPEDGSAWHADQVVAFLDEHHAARDARPFLVYLGFSHPHDPRQASAERLAKYSDAPLPANYASEHPFHHGHPELRDEVAVAGVMRARDPATVRAEVVRQFACIEEIDAQIGRVLQKLEAIGERENTIVVYTSDHGIAVGRHGLMGKQNLYEHTWRVPMIVAGPGVAPGARATGNVYLLDLLGTLCELAEVPVPATFEGRSFAPVLAGEQQTVREVLYGAYCGGTKPGMRSVRQGDWKLIKYDVLEGQVRETQLFDLASNPLERIGGDGNRRDLAEDPRFAEKRRELEALLLREMERLGDPYRLWDQG